MTIAERLEQKRAEYAQVNAQQEQLYIAVRQTQKAHDEALTPWSDAYNKANQILKEIEALESIAKELGAA